jgi:hypothetical protein
MGELMVIDWNAGQNVTDHYRELADKIISLFNPPDDSILVEALERAARYIRNDVCDCAEDYETEDDVCGRCAALGQFNCKPVQR